MFPTFSFWFFLLLIFNFWPITTAFTLGNKTDHLALLKFKQLITNDPYGILDSWNGSSHFCKWHGITCNPVYQRVSKLNLPGYKLHGSLSSHVANLSFLKIINLADNKFFGKIPQEFGHLLQLQQLYLTNNSFDGKIPINLTNCYNLIYLSLRGNNLIGKIPIEIGSLQKLKKLTVRGNNLIGGVPSSIGNLSLLTGLSVSYNNLEGDIPQEICRLKNLSSLVLFANYLSGTFPLCVYNMSSLTMISAAQNQFSGSLPPNMFNNLPNLQDFLIGDNYVSGLMPTSVANASTLTTLDVGKNNLAGKVPSLGRLKYLGSINLEINNFGYNSSNDLEFLKSLINCSNLEVVSISYNNFGGSLSGFIGNLSTQLSRLYLGYNQIYGKIPLELGNLNSLILLDMGDNHFQGRIPSAIGKFQRLQVLNLGGNNLSGEIPSFIGNLSRLYRLNLGKNMFEGTIPTSIGNCQNIQILDFSKNNLRGVIPLEVFNISSLTKGLFLSQNFLSGSLPDELGHLQNIVKIDVSKNRLSGKIPITVGKCICLEYLILAENSFNGSIPYSLESVKVLKVLDLSRNQLSGLIPNALQNISSLEYFNVSFNMLEGEVPTKGVFRNASAFTVIGNNKLCGGILELHLSPCPIKGTKLANHHNFKLMVLIVSVISFLFIMLSILAIYWRRGTIKKPSFDSPIIDQMIKVSYQNLHRATNGFSKSNLIGSGNFGSVYKGTLASIDGFVAIKVLNLTKKGSHKSFIAECNALKNIRHRNLVKILTCCSSTDYKGNEFKALVFEYMRNGNLESWLHPSTEITDEPKSLNLEQRFNIIIDVASAFCYLHYECEQPVIHCDLKPANVLLNDTLVAQVSDFGLARLVSSACISLKQSSTIGIKGTVGYAPIEYGMGSEVSMEGDMYSFGILVLEMLTGRRPTDEMFKDDHNLHNYVKLSIPNHLFEIVDRSILPVELENNTENGNSGSIDPNVEKCLLSIFRIALSCSVESPKERMNMVDVIRELNVIKCFFPFN
ncbi:probable LRR receptor-like serine/threonine-protein kinase At3g47570 [Vicia villosa]|uniref:probable LRR receptor-like serine/threonine-protein kinase At3g47570 n=1 Tax=Vicia villosa TaxID=3911 RepID=UPI00273AD5BD|nr:probable LRR receptor-like serine/threonine-protein kinase At3g47570 [Vicia villosa]